MKKAYIPKEISWLSFNARVLQEADNPRVPLMERVKFLGIYSSNLDQFFEIRVATLKRLSRLEPGAVKFLEGSPKKLLKNIEDFVKSQRGVFDRVYAGIMKALEAKNVRIINEKQLTVEQAAYIHSYFRRRVQSKIFPIRTRKKGEFPVLNDKALYLAVRMVRTQDPLIHYSIIEIPSETLPRFVELPKEGDKRVVMLLDDIVRHELGEIFTVYDYDRFEAYEFKLNRDAELDVDDDISESYIEKIDKSLRKRKYANPVRFMHDAAMPADMVEFLLGKLDVGKSDTVLAGGRYHNTSDFLKFPPLLKGESLPDIEQVPHPMLPPRVNFFNVLRARDVLIHFPFHSFDIILDFLRQASIDSRVTSIKMTLYRLAKNSSVINALINARKNNKKITVVMELQARFDEEANISWANRLEQEGIGVVFGVEGLKVHSKLCLVTREESEGPHRKIRQYCMIGTGNFNENTACGYIDTCLLTSSRKIGADVGLIFDFFEHNFKLRRTRYLLLSPFSMRKELYRLIAREIKHAKDGKMGSIDIKINNLSDYGVIRQLYRASAAGVKIRIICRGMFSLVAGVSGTSGNIEAISIVDRFLEHARYFIFGNDGDPACFLSSADWLPRNLDRRIEVACPIFDKALRNEMVRIFEIGWKDNVKARILSSWLDNEFRRSQDAVEWNSQKELGNYLAGKAATGGLTVN